ncbi:MAG: hypothetical protein ACTH5W_20205 [Providencia sp.]|uniref:hypothetical protein n=1 Tax=Providencia sp. TaxID=589 RepID=UPI003F9D675C
MIPNKDLTKTSELTIRLLGVLGYQTNLLIAKASLEDAVSAKHWPKTHDKKDGYGGWDWQDLWSQYRLNKLCISIKISGKAGALFCGRVKGDCVNIEYIQRNYACEELRGNTAKIVVVYSISLAKILGKEFIRISNPAPKIVSYYIDILGQSIRTEYDISGQCLLIECSAKDVLTHLSQSIINHQELLGSFSELPEITNGSSSM